MRQFDIGKIEKEKPESPERPKRRQTVLPYFLGLILGLLLVFGIFQISAKKEKTETKVVETKTQQEAEEALQEEQIETATPFQEESAPPSLDKSKVPIQVLNGNGIRGDAYQTKLILEKDGWKVANYGNAGSFKYQSTPVYYKEGQEEAGKAVEETLKKSGKVTSLEKSTSLTKYDVLVIVGKK